MPGDWSDFRDRWLSKTPLESEDAIWAIESLKAYLETYGDLAKAREKEKVDNAINNETLEKIKRLRKGAKSRLTEAENTLDDLSLNSPNSYKLQVSVPCNLTYLMKAWAAAEGRDLSSVALQCLEVGLRDAKKNEGIPVAAIKKYDLACEKRIALAEVNHLWEKELNSIGDYQL